MMKIQHQVLFLSLCIVTPLQAETTNLVFGMVQPVFLNGGNIEVNYLTDDWVFEYSHGFDLDLNASPGDRALTSEERRQGLKIYVPYSTGGGIGYRFTRALNIRIEFKQHEFQVTHPSGEQVTYTNQDLGIGAYYFYTPSSNSHFLIVPSLRYWPTLNSSLAGDQHTFSNGDVHKAHEFGLFANVSIGWRF